MYKLANGYEALVPAIAKAWGYSEKSSGAAQTVAALKMFGLVDDMGSGATRKLKLTEPALKIIRDPREISPDRDALIKAAALKPPIHREVIEHYGGSLPPSDEHFKAFLLMDRNFRDDAANEFMREFAATMSFAKVSSTGTIEPEPATSGSEPKPAGDTTGLNFTKKPPKPLPPAAHNKVPIMEGERELTTGLLAKGTNFRLIVSGPVGERELDRLIKKLQFDKEILADEGADAPDDPE